MIQSSGLFELIVGDEFPGYSGYFPQGRKSEPSDFVNDGEMIEMMPI